MNINRPPIRPRPVRRPPAVSRSASGLPLIPGLNVVEEIGRVVIDKSLNGNIFRLHTLSGSLASLEVFSTQESAAAYARKYQGLQGKEISDVA